MQKPNFLNADDFNMRYIKLLKLHKQHNLVWAKGLWISYEISLKFKMVNLENSIQLFSLINHIILHKIILEIVAKQMFKIIKNTFVVFILLLNLHILTLFYVVLKWIKNILIWDRYLFDRGTQSISINFQTHFDSLRFLKKNLLNSKNLCLQSLKFLTKCQLV